MEQLYFLSRSDKWYIGRITRVLDDSAKKDVINALKYRAGINIQKSRVAAYIKDCYSSFFSVNYTKFEKLLKGELFMSKDDMPNKEAIINFFETGNELFKLSELVRERADLNFDDIGDNEMDRLFLEAYQDKNRFTGLCLDFSRLIIELLKPPTKVGAFPAKKFTELERRLKFDECTLPYIHQHALSDL